MQSKGADIKVRPSSPFSSCVLKRDHIVATSAATVKDVEEHPSLLLLSLTNYPSPVLAN